MKCDRGDRIRRDDKWAIRFGELGKEIPILGPVDQYISLSMKWNLAHSFEIDSSQSEVRPTSSLLLENWNESN